MSESTFRYAAAGTVGGIYSDRSVFAPALVFGHNSGTEVAAAYLKGVW